MWVETSSCMDCLAGDKDPCHEYLEAVKKVDKGNAGKAQCMSYDYRDGYDEPKQFRAPSKGPDDLSPPPGLR